MYFTTNKPNKMKTSTRKKQDEEIVVAKDGNTYVIVDEKEKICKRVQQTTVEFVNNLTADVLDEKFEKQNTQILYKYIAAKFPESRMSGRWIHVADYKIRYSSHGYRIHDMRKQGELVNINKWNNDFASPEDVLTFIESTVKRIAEVSAKVVSRAEVEKGNLFKLATIGKAVLVDEDGSPNKKIKSLLPEKKKDRLFMDLQRFFIGYKEGKHTFRSALIKIQDRAPEKLRLPLKALLSGYKNKTITWRKLTQKLDEMVEKYLAEKKAEKPVRQPKFQAPFLLHPIQEPMIEVRDELVDEIQLNPDLKCLETNVCMPDLMWMQFETRGPSNKRVHVITTLEGYLANVVLHHYPRAMQLLMKVAMGEVERPTAREINMRSFLKDPFQQYNEKWMQHPVDREAFCGLCLDILRNDGVQTCFDYVYSEQYKVGEQVKVISQHTGLSDFGEVVETEGGVTIRYEFGSVERLRKCEVIIPYQWRKVKK